MIITLRVPSPTFLVKILGQNDDWPVDASCLFSHSQFSGFSWLGLLLLVAYDPTNAEFILVPLDPFWRIPGIGCDIHWHPRCLERIDRGDHCHMELGEWRHGMALLRTIVKGLIIVMIYPFCCFEKLMFIQFYHFLSIYSICMFIFSTSFAPGCTSKYNWTSFSFLPLSDLWALVIFPGCIGAFLW